VKLIETERVFHLRHPVGLVILLLHGYQDIS
jgi:hypothetical protein